MIRILVIVVLLSFSAIVPADELYQELDCPQRLTWEIAGSVLGAALVYEMITPNVPQQNGITFLTSIAVGGLAGGFAGAVFAQKRCQSHVALTPNGVQLCYDF